jgi:hypothetical protein
MSDVAREIITQIDQQKERQENQATTEYPAGTSSVSGHEVPSGETLVVPVDITLWTWGDVTATGTFTVNGTHVVV